MLSRKALFILFLVPSAISLLRLFRIMVTTTSSSPPPPFSPTTPNLPLGSSCPPPAQAKPSSSSILRHPHISPTLQTFTSKELRLLSNVISQRAPCNLLFFGFHRNHLRLSGLNAGGRTVFLEDDADNLGAAPRESPSLRVYKVEHNTAASQAYDLLRRARADPACARGPGAGGLRSSTCELAPSWLPEEVYGRDWDVIVVDGPSGDKPEAPGRMTAIYSAGVMARGARKGKGAADVVVHDVDRTVERWYSWEYLCQENLAASKGKLWHFRILRNSTSLGFCSEGKVAAIM